MCVMDGCVAVYTVTHHVERYCKVLMLVLLEEAAVRPSLCQSRILLFDGILFHSTLCFPHNKHPQYKLFSHSVMFPSLIALAKASYTSAPTAALAGRTFKRAQKGLFNGKMKRFGGLSSTTKTMMTECYIAEYTVDTAAQ